MSSPLGGATCLTPWCQGPGGKPVTCRTRGVESREVVVLCEKCWDHPKISFPFPARGKPLAHLCSSSPASLLSPCPRRPSLSPAAHPLFAFLTACPSPHSPPSAHCISLSFSVFSAPACSLSPKQGMLAVALGSPGSTSHPPMCTQDISTPRALHPEPSDLLAPSLAGQLGGELWLPRGGW